MVKTMFSINLGDRSGKNVSEYAPVAQGLSKKVLRQISFSSAALLI